MEHLIAWLNAERGRRQKLADALDIYASALSQWNQVPATRATEVSDITGIPLHQLRPDVFPVPAKAGAAA